MYVCVYRRTVAKLMLATGRESELQLLMSPTTESGRGAVRAVISELSVQLNFNLNCWIPVIFILYWMWLVTCSRYLG